MLKKVVSTVRSSTFLRHNAIFFAGAVAVGVLNYAYYPILGRMLDIEAYGEVQALVALFLQLVIFLTVLSQITVNVVANYKDELQKQKVVYELEKVALYMSLFMLLVVVAFGWQLKDFLNFTSVWPFIILMFAVVATVPLTFRSAFLRGHKKFGLVSGINLTAAATKIIFSVGLVAVGWSTGGAIVGIVAAQVVAFLFAAHAAYKIGFRRPEGASHATLPDLKVLRPEVKYGLFVLCGSLIVTVLSSIDIFVVKHYFSPQVAGEYAGISTVARMIYFLTASVAQVLLPSVRINQPARENRMFLVKSLALVGVLGGGALLVFTLFSKQIITILMGHAYTTYVHLLPELSLAMLIISVLNLVISYYIALRRYQISGIVIFGALVTGWLLFVNHTTLQDVVNSLTIGSASMLGMLVLWRVYYAWKMRTR